MTADNDETVIACVVHLSDLHLFVDPDGGHLESADQRRWVAVLKAVLKRLDGELHEGLDYADPNAADDLIHNLKDLIEAQRLQVGDSPLILVQSGDVAAFGSAPDDAPHAFRLLLDNVWPELRRSNTNGRGIDGIIDIFGNHDLWPGTFPAPGPTKIQDEVLASLQRHVPDFRGEWPRAVNFSEGGVNVSIIYLNSVRRDLVGGGILAKGRVDSLPYDAVDRWDERLRQLDLPNDSLKIAVLHHPIHDFDGPKPGGHLRRTGDLISKSLYRWGLKKTPTFEDRSLEHGERLASILEQKGVHLVLAGHRHQLDPPLRTRLQQGDQAPFTTTIQLTAETPTQLATDAAGERSPGHQNSVCVYQVLRRESDTIRIRRLRYTYSEAKGFGFSGRPSTVEELLAAEVPLT